MTWLTMRPDRFTTNVSGTPQAIGQRRLRTGVLDDRVRDVLGPDVAAGGPGAVFEVDADHDHTGILELLPCLVESRLLNLALRAPRGPEVDDDDLPAQLGERHGRAVQLGQGEVRCRA